MRYCKKCLQNKDLSEFKKHSNGYRHVCKKCQYIMEMTNPVAYANRIARMQRYRDSEQGKETEKKYTQSIEGKQIRRKAIKKYEETLSGYLNKRTTTAKRRAARIQRTPSWLTDFDKLKIKCIYAVATMLTRENKEEWTVDHIIPLQGKLVSGLHVPNNLQVMRGSENYSKINKFEVSL
jgi:hypothetical protein